MMEISLRKQCADRSARLSGATSGYRWSGKTVSLTGPPKVPIRPTGTVVPSVRPVPWCRSGLKAGFLGPEGGSSIFFWDLPPSGRRGLEGKNQSFKVSRGLEEEARKEKT